MKQVVIVGASHAAAESIASLRKFGWQGNIVLIGDETMLPYQRPPLSKAYYKGDVETEKLLIRPESFYEKNKVDLMLGHRVTSIDRETKTVHLDSSQTLPYDHLILATGTRARKLPIEGAELNNIHYLRSKQDVDNIKAGLKKGGELFLPRTTSARRRRNSIKHQLEKNRKKRFSPLCDRR